MRSPRECAKCQGAMGEGFLIDHTYGSIGVGKWVEGSPVRSFWLGLKLRGKQQLAVKTYRCGRCGYLESYAPG